MLRNIQFFLLLLQSVLRVEELPQHHCRRHITHSNKEKKRRRRETYLLPTTNINHYTYLHLTLSTYLLNFVCLMQIPPGIMTCLEMTFYDINFNFDSWNFANTNFFIRRRDILIPTRRVDSAETTAQKICRPGFRQKNATPYFGARPPISLSIL